MVNSTKLTPGLESQLNDILENATNAKFEVRDELPGLSYCEHDLNKWMTIQVVPSDRV